MPQPITVDILDRMRPNLASLLQERAKSLPGMRYCDLRISVREERGAVAENGNEKASAEDYSFDFGVRAIAGARVSAAGYFGRILGSADAANIEKIVWQGIRQAHQRARSSARYKSVSRGRFGALGTSITGTELAPVPAAEDSVPAIYTVDPRAVPLADAVKLAVDGCNALRGQSNNIVYSATSASTFLLRELFLSSDGAGHRPELCSDRGIRHRHLRWGKYQLRIVRLHRPSARLGGPDRRLPKRAHRFAQLY